MLIFQSNKYFRMKYHLLKRISILMFLAVLNSVPLYSQHDARLQRIAAEKLKSWKNPLTQWQNIAIPKLDSIRFVKDPETLTLFYAPALSYYPFREESCELFIQSVKESLGRRFRKYGIEVITSGFLLNQLVPNYYRQRTPVDSTRFPVISPGRKILVQKLNGIYPGKGLTGKSVALWHSHGYYFEMNLDRWEWQRAKLFGTVEDISVMGFVVPYLVKMLENAGANVFLPRERDIQTSEVIVDNDRSTGNSEVVLQPDTETRIIDKGFLLTDTLFPGYNPFKHGTSLLIRSDTAVCIPEIPEKGYYAVYIS